MRCQLRNLQLVAFALLAAVGSAAAQKAGEGYEISGKDQLLAGQKIYLQASEIARHGDPFLVLDSAQADAVGQFVMRGRVAVPGMYLLRVGPQKSLTPLPLGNHEKVTVKAEKLPSGSPIGAAVRLRVSGTSEIDLWNKALQSFSLSVAAVPATDRKLNEFKALLLANAGSYLAPYLAYRFLRVQDSQRPFLDSLTARFGREQPGSAYLPRLRELLRGASTLDVGALAPDISLAGPDGKTVALSSLRGQYVLLDFWASWCGPCRAENPNVLAAYQQYQHKGKGFAVYAVSLDDSRDKWQRAVQQDALPWTQVSDLQGLQSGVAQTYKIVAIPATLLLDPEGRIIAKNLRGKELSKELGRLLR